MSIFSTHPSYTVDKQLMNVLARYARRLLLELVDILKKKGLHLKEGEGELFFQRVNTTLKKWLVRKNGILK